MYCSMRKTNLSRGLKLFLKVCGIISRQHMIKQSTSKNDIVSLSKTTQSPENTDDLRRLDFDVGCDDEFDDDDDDCGIDYLN